MARNRAQERLNPERVRVLGARMKAILELAGSPVGVRLLFDERDVPSGAHSVTHHRYCQAVMKTRKGEHVTLDTEGLSCPPAAAAFGFKPLPPRDKKGAGSVLLSGMQRGDPLAWRRGSVGCPACGGRVHDPAARPPEEFETKGSRPLFDLATAGMVRQVVQGRFVSETGCSSRMPGDIRSYGSRGIHGCALPIATGLKLARPALTVKAASGWLLDWWGPDAIV